MTTTHLDHAKTDALAEGIQHFDDTWSVVPPTGSVRPGIWLDPELRDAVLLHLAKNHMHGQNPALMLAIQGRQGEGKTFQIRQVCSAANAYVIPVSGGSLSAGNGRSAGEKLQHIYVFASRIRTHLQSALGQPVMVVIVVDDFDLSVASVHGNIARTVDTQLLTGVLMNLADDPYHCGRENTLRIPIILSGNNFTFLHGPLTRHGRMSFFEWAPGMAQRINIVRTLFSQALSTDELAQIEAFLLNYRHQPISFFSALKDDLMNSIILAGITSDDMVNVGGLEIRVSASLGTHRLARLYELAEQRTSSTGKTYL